MNQALRDVLDACRAAGVTLRVDGEKLKATPKGRLTDALRAALSTHAGELVAHLSKPPAPAEVQTERLPIGPVGPPVPSASEKPVKPVKPGELDDEYRAAVYMVWELIAKGAAPTQEECVAALAAETEMAQALTPARAAELRATWAAEWRAVRGVCPTCGTGGCDG